MAKLPGNVVNQLADGAADDMTDRIENHMMRHPQRYGLTTVEIEARCLDEASVTSGKSATASAYSAGGAMSNERTTVEPQ